MAINLLPPKFKQEKEYKKAMKTLVLFLTAFLFLLLIATGGIMAAEFFVKNDLDKISGKIAEENKVLLTYKSTENDLKNVNAKLLRIDSLNQTKILWSNLIIDLASKAPTNLQIKTLSLSQDSKKTTITGFAETRNDIANFKEKLENSKHFKNVVFSSSVHNESQGNFSFNMSCEIEEIK